MVVFLKSHCSYKSVLTAWRKNREVKSNEQEIQYAACVQQCLEIIQNSYADSSLSVSQIADRLSFTASYLSRYFKQQTGIGLVDYIHQYRLVAAKKLLTENADQPIGIIAEQTGFYNAAALIRVFKKFEGMTPGQYRQQDKEQSEGFVFCQWVLY